MCLEITTRLVAAGIAGTFYGAVGAGMAAACTSAGAAVLDASGHGGYSALAGARQGAIGGAILNGGIKALHALVSPRTFHTETSSGDLIGLVGGTVLCALTGYGVMRHDNITPNMDIGPTAAAAAVGAAIIYGGLAILVGGPARAVGKRYEASKEPILTRVGTEAPAVQPAVISAAVGATMRQLPAYFTDASPLSDGELESSEGPWAQGLRQRKANRAATERDPFVAPQVQLV